MRALITGGSGYLGRHITQRLLEAGWDVINYDLKEPLVTFHPERDEWVEGDITDTPLLTTCLQCYPVDLVIHAALARDLPSGGLKVAEELSALNVEGTRSLLWAMASVGCERLMALSGARAYGFSQQPYILEEEALSPEGKIGESLRAAEEMMVEFRQGLPGRLALLRVFEVYGYGSSELLKAFATSERDVFLEHLSRWQKTEASFLFGQDFTTRDGTYVRDFMHVSDLSRVVLEAAKFLDQEPELICNLGLGKGYSQLDLFKMLEGLSGLAAKISVKDRRPEEAPRLVANKEYLFAWCGDQFLDFPRGLRELTESLGFSGGEASDGAVEKEITVDDEEDSPWSVMEDVTGPSDSVLAAVAAASEKLSLFGDGP